MNDNVLMEMLIEQSGLIKTVEKKIDILQNTSPQIDVSRVEQLSNQMETSVAKLDEAMEQARQPIVKENRFIFDITSNSTFFLFLGGIIIISALTVALYLATNPNYDRIDNDLKYRYIKMKGEATPKLISKLENLFELNRDNTIIHQIRKDVEQYEETILKQATLEEQSRLKQQAAELLDSKARQIKQK